MGLFRRKRDFNAEVRRSIKELVSADTPIAEIDADSVQVGSLVIGLGNLRAKWNRLAEEDRLPWLQSALPALVSPPSMPARLETTQPLRPGIRPRSMLESARLTNLNNEINPGAGLNRPLIPFQPFGGDLVTVLLWDAPTTMSVVNQSQLEEWGARFNDLLPVAIDNLRNSLRPGGSLLLTGPVTSPSAPDLPSDAWRFTPLGLRLLAEGCAADGDEIEVVGYGNRVSSVAFLLGLSLEDLRRRDLDPYDPYCPLLVGLRLTRSAAG